MKIPSHILRYYIRSYKNCKISNFQIFSRRNYHYKKDDLNHSNKIKLYAGAFTSILLAAYVLKKRKPSLVPQENTIQHKYDYIKNQLKPNNEQSLRTKFNFIDKIVKQCAPSVFYLEIRDPSKIDPETGESVVMSNGSGFVISDDGYALTNAHVVLNKTNSVMNAIFKNGQSYPVQIEDLDVNMDLALLKVHAPQHSLDGLKLEEPGDTNVGEWVVALGSPLSLTNSVTVGIVSCVDRPGEELGLKNFPMTYIQTDASITFGNSGGPLVNLDGNVIGINNLRLTSGISFAIPIEYVKRFLENTRIKKASNLKTNKSKTLFGITTISVSHDVINDLMGKTNYMPQNVTHGLLIWKLLKDSPAYKAGLEVSDIITSINGVPVKDASDLYNVKNSEKLLKLEIIKNGNRKTLFVENT